MPKLTARDMRPAVIAAVTASLVAAVPAVGSAVVATVRNSDKVDGRHAVASGASIKARRGKLVATSSKTGRLPNNIIATAPNAKRLGGKGAGEFSLKASLSSPGTINSASNPVAWSKLRGVPEGLSDGLDDIGPRAFSHVTDAGFADTDLSLGIDSEDITHPGTGVYCFELSFEPKHVQVTTDHRSDDVVEGSVEGFASFQPAAINSSGNCGPDSQADAVVIFRDAVARYNAAFFVSFM